MAGGGIVSTSTDLFELQFPGKTIHGDGGCSSALEHPAGNFRTMLQ
jgi:hypothetical protein